jgi:hypothetical protein
VLICSQLTPPFVDEKISFCCFETGGLAPLLS